MKKIFLYLFIVFIIILSFIYLYNSRIDFYNIEFLHPLFWFLIPVTCLLFFCIFLKNIKSKSVLVSLLFFGITSFAILAAVDPFCSGIVCFDRSQTALILSSLFSFIYFIILLIKNKKKTP